MLHWVFSLVYCLLLDWLYFRFSGFRLVRLQKLVYSDVRREILKLVLEELLLFLGLAGEVPLEQRLKTHDQDFVVRWVLLND